MVATSVWQDVGLESRLWGDNGIAVFRAQGEFYGQLAAPMLAHAQDTVAAWRSDALVADYTASRLRITSAQLAGSITNVIHKTGALSLPTALVVRRDDLAVWDAYARALAEDAGILRGVFLDYDEALRWVRLQAEIFRITKSRRAASQ